MKKVLEESWNKKGRGNDNDLIISLSLS